MKIYTVGGAVRDHLLGKKPSDIDYVVVGATPEKMTGLGFKQVGADFPVFLHPITGDEYALARKEKRTGKNYTDFETSFDPSVTLEDDLSRRDLTINAMAMDESGVLYDPFGGKKDLDNRLIRHVSDAFKEDPVRILRIARFCAKMPDFTVAEDTTLMVREMVSNGELDNLTKERIWKEFYRAMQAESSVRFIETLDTFNALEKILPEIHKMKGVPQRADYHAEGDVYIHTLMVLDECVKLSKGLSDDNKLLTRMAALYHDIGKAYTPNSLLYETDGSIKGHHHGHDDKTLVSTKLKEVADRLTMTNDVLTFCIDVAAVHQKVHQIQKMTPKGVTKMFNELSIRQKSGNGKEEQYVDNLMLVCYADALGRKVTVNNTIVDAPKDYLQKDIFKKYFKEYSNTAPALQDWIKTYTEKNDKKPEGELIKSQLHRIRINNINKVKA